MVNPVYDVIILGGGLVGLTAANLCAQAGLSVAIIEAKVPMLDWPAKSTDVRCSAISKGAQTIFETIDIWNDIDGKVSPYRQMVVWDALGFGEITFDAIEVAEPDLGHIIENRVMIKALWEKALRQNIMVLSATHPIDMHIEADKAILKLDNNSVLQAKLLVGADGGRSWLREKANLKTIHKNYQQQAIVATVTTELNHQETAWQRFLPEGPLAFLPLLGSHTSSIVWTTTEDKAKVLMGLSDEAFCQALGQGLDYRLGRIMSTSRRLQFPLVMMHAQQYVADRIALIGDAAHVIHPLAGQGVNLGLQDAKILAEVLSHANNNQYDIGHYLVLRKYERARKGHVSTMITAMNFFKEIFGIQSAMIAVLRSFGLNMVNKNQRLKKHIIYQAMGH